MAKARREPGSYGMLSLAVMQDQRLTMAEKAVWAALIVEGRGRDQFDVSMTGLAELSGASRSTVIRCLPNLEAAGWLTVTHVKGYLTKVCLHDTTAGDTSSTTTLRGVPQRHTTSSTANTTSSTTDDTCTTGESETHPLRYKDLKDPKDEYEKGSAYATPWKDEENASARTYGSPSLPLDPYERRPGESENDYCDRLDTMELAKLPDDPPERKHSYEEDHYGRSDFSKYTITPAPPPEPKPDVPAAEAPPKPRWRQAVDDLLYGS